MGIADFADAFQLTARGTNWWHWPPGTGLSQDGTGASGRPLAPGAVATLSFQSQAARGDL